MSNRVDTPDEPMEPFIVHLSCQTAASPSTWTGPSVTTASWTKMLWIHCAGDGHREHPIKRTKMYIDLFYHS